MNRIEVIEVVKFPIDFRGFGCPEVCDEKESEPYTFTMPCRDLMDFNVVSKKNSGITHPIPRYCPPRSPLMM